MSDLSERLRASSTINDDVYALRHEAADEIASLRAQLAIAGEHIAEMMDQLASARKALEGVLDHMDRNGMMNWPVAKRVRKELDALTSAKGKSDG